MPLSRAELQRIARLRELFLDADRGAERLADYWRDAADLEAYDRVLAARIGWKWDAALAECASRGFGRADSDTIVDFGCGSGIAARRFVAAFGGRAVLLHDRSALAMTVAVNALTAAAPAVAAAALPAVDAIEPDVLLVSHVLSELDARGLAALRRLIDRSRRVVLVESGNLAASRRLSALRDDLLATFRVIAPCPHANACPALATDGDWCHFFAAPPPEVFTDGEWVRTARAMAVDLRALPYAFVALAREPAAVPSPPNRVLGRPRVESRVARVQVCSSSGIGELVVPKGDALYRTLKKRPESVRTMP